MIQSAEQGTVKPEGVMVIDNSTHYGFQRYLQERQKEDPTLECSIPIAIMNSPVNLGCARAWNAGLKTVYENSPNSYVLVANDDITFLPDCIELFDRATKERPNSIIFCAGGMDAPNAFSLFCTRYDILNDSVGLFDEMFLYPYCEDGDMARRLMFYGQELDRVEGATAMHIGSATLKAFTEQEQEDHHVRFKRNAEYFKLKWGIDHNNIYSKEGYTLPFDGSEAEEIMATSYMKYAYGA